MFLHFGLREVNSLGESREHQIKFSSAFLFLIFLTGLFAGVITTYYIDFQQISSLRNDVSSLRAQVSNLWGFQNVTYQSITIYQNSTALSELYDRVNASVVLIRGVTATESVQGSGFVYNYSGTLVVLTNYHVVHGTISVSVTFSNGNGYAARVNGTDPYADLAVLTVVGAPESEFKPLAIVSSSTLRVGDPVIAIGNPYGLVGSMTTGIISALGRTIEEREIIGNFRVANIIQTNVLINPGNSGGPLLNYCGEVVGITTAIVKDSQGLAFAVPSNAILREVDSLIKSGTYEGHSYVGVAGIDMDYETAQLYQASVTYGWRVGEVITGGPAYNAGIQVGDIIVGLNWSRIMNGDQVLSYLEENTLPGETLTLNILRSNQTLEIQVILGRRPPPV